MNNRDWQNIERPVFNEEKKSRKVFQPLFLKFVFTFLVLIFIIIFLLRFFQERSNIPNNQLADDQQVDELTVTPAATKILSVEEVFREQLSRLGNLLGEINLDSNEIDPPLVELDLDLNL